MSISCSECNLIHENDKISKCMNCSSYTCTLCNRKCISCERYVCISCAEDNIMREFKKAFYVVHVPGWGTKRVQGEEISHYLKLKYHIMPMHSTYYKCYDCCEI